MPKKRMAAIDLLQIYKENLTWQYQEIDTQANAREQEELMTLKRQQLSSYVKIAALQSAHIPFAFHAVITQGKQF
jgi:hypothetical protein